MGFITYTHQREAWQDPNVPVQSTSAFEWSDVDLEVMHYTADDDLPDGDIGEFIDDVAQYLRNIQRDYVVNRGYSIGYNVAVDWLGGTWELRGEDYECAANVEVNSHAFAVLVLVDGQDRMTAEAAEAVRALTLQVLAATGGRIGPLVGHYQVATHSTGTQCPGTGIKIDLAEGILDPRTWTPPPVVVPPPDPDPVPDPGDIDTMIRYIAKKADGSFVIGDGLIRNPLLSDRQARKVIGRYIETGVKVFDWESKAEITALRQLKTDVNTIAIVGDLGSLVND